MQADVVSHEDWLGGQSGTVYKCVLDKASAAGIPFALGGGLALSVYTGTMRASKDMDLYVLPEHREQVIGILGSCGLEDYHSVKEYVRHWIYRGYREDSIVDVIWAMANHRAEVDARWITAGPRVRILGKQVRVIPPEELIWSKLYVLQRDRCDWPDILNLLNATAATLDWDHLLTRAAEDGALIKAVLSIFSWICPSRARAIPRRIWDSLGLSPVFSDTGRGDRPSPKDLLDTRPWFFEACHA